MNDLLNINKIKFNKNKVLFLIAIAIVTTLFFFRDVRSYGFNQYIEVTVLAIFIPFLNYRYLTAYTCYVIPLTTGMNTIICLLLLIGLIFKSPNINRYQIGISVILSLIELMNFYLYPNYYRVNDYILYASILCLMIFLIFDESRNVNYSLNIKMFCISTAVVMCLILYRSYQTYGPIGIFMNRIGDAELDDNMRQGGLRIFSMNANTVGYFCAVTYSCLLLGRKKLKMNIVLYSVVLIIILVAGALSVSRTWILIVILATLVYAILYTSKWMLIMIISASFIFGGTVVYYMEDFIKPFEQRFDSNDISSGNGRAEVFEKFVHYQYENPGTIPFGIGAVAYKDVSHIKSSMHNASQQIFVCTGLFGLLIFVYMAYKFYKLFIYKKKIQFLYLLPMISGFLFVQSIQFLNPYYLMLPFIVSSMAIKLGNKSL